MSIKRAIKILYGITDEKAPVNMQVCEDFLKGDTSKIDCKLLTLALNKKYPCAILPEKAYTREGYIQRHINANDSSYIKNVKRSFYSMLYDMEIEIDPFDGRILETKDFIKQLPFEVTDEFIHEMNNHLIELIKEHGWEVIDCEHI